MTLNSINTAVQPPILTSLTFLRRIILKKYVLFYSYASHHCPYTWCKSAGGDEDRGGRGAHHHWRFLFPGRAVLCGGAEGIVFIIVNLKVVGNSSTHCPSLPSLPHSRCCQSTMLEICRRNINLFPHWENRTGHVNLFNANNNGLLLTCGGSLLGAFPALDCLQLDRATR